MEQERDSLKERLDGTRIHRILKPYIKEGSTKFTHLLRKGTGGQCKNKTCDLSRCKNNEFKKLSEIIELVGEILNEELEERVR